MCTATLREAPICAIHSRSAEMAISRPMMTKATRVSTRSCCNSTKSDAQIKNLSATGSKKAPKAEVWSSLRASQPSSQSVAANSTNIVVATRFLVAMSHDK